MSEKEKPKLKKHVGAIAISNRDISLLQRKLFNVLLLNAMESLEDENGLYSISLSRLASMIRFESNHIKHLKDSIGSLVSTKVEWNLLDEKNRAIWGMASMLPSVQISNGILEYAFASHLKKYLINPEIYAYIKLSTQNLLSSKYSLILYELCTRYKGVKSTGPIKVEDLKKILGIDQMKTFEVFAKIKDKILKPSIDEISRKTDIRVTCELEKAGKRVYQVKFKIEENKDFKPVADPMHQLSLIEPKPTSEDYIQPSRIEKELYSQIALKEIRARKVDNP